MTEKESVEHQLQVVLISAVPVLRHEKSSSVTLGVYEGKKDPSINWFGYDATLLLRYNSKQSVKMMTYI